jgi:nucleoside-diphosphate-sugar epimerase
MELHVVVGSGAIGTAAARLLLESGHQVRVVTRSGSGPDGAERIAADATDPARLTALTAGAAALYNCASPQYHRWLTDWPPIAKALLTTAERTGAVLATVSNLYGYGPVAGPMTEQTPLRPASAKAAVRVTMWQDALAAHEAGKARVTEVRGSDYLGAGAKTLFTDFILPSMLAGKTVRTPGDPDAPHSWTYTGDMARLLVTAAADERAWGRAWHVPTAPPATLREVIAMAAEIAELPVPPIARIPGWLVAGGSLVVRDLRELRKVLYQFDRPFVLDSSAAQRTFGLVPTPLAESVAESVSDRSARTEVR